MAYSIQIDEPGAGIPADGALLYHHPVSFIQPPELETLGFLGDLMTREELFLAHHGLIERLVAWVCARRGLRSADAQDFASTVKLRLVENDYEILGKFEGRSSIQTYLATVINRIYLDFQAERFGKWRHSAEARRRGPVALRLERLVYRDGYTFDEAAGILKTNEQVPETRDELHAIFVELPCRPSRRAKAIASEPSTTSDGPISVERAERQKLAEQTFAVLRRVLASAPAEDRLFLRLHMEGGFKVADAARSLGEDQKALYRKKDACLKAMRLELEAQGIRECDVHELLAHMDWHAALSAHAAESGLQREEGEP